MRHRSCGWCTCSPTSRSSWRRRTVWGWDRPPADRLGAQLGVRRRGPGGRRRPGPRPARRRAPGVRRVPMIAAPVEVCEDPVVHEGAALLSGVTAGPSLAAHRRRYDDLPSISVDDLLDAVGHVGLRGRGGAAFPFGTKLGTVAKQRRRPVVVVNLSEGEPASSKDTALARTRPHLVLDGAVGTARALGARQVHVVRRATGRSPRRPWDRRSQSADRGVRLVSHAASPRFVAGQSRAVLELMAGRPNLPVTGWTPEAVSGHRSRPTLLSNAETSAWRQVVARRAAGRARYRRGTRHHPAHPATAGQQGRRPRGRVRDTPADPAPGRRRRRAARRLPRSLGTAGPGPPTSGVGVGSARGRIGSGGWPDDGRPRLPRGLDPASGRLSGGAERAPLRTVPQRPSGALDRNHALDDGAGTGRIEELLSLVERRGACAHPDGTARLVRSLLRVYPDEVERHQAGRCAFERRAPARRLRSVMS